MLNVNRRFLINWIILEHALSLAFRRQYLTVHYLHRKRMEFFASLADSLQPIIICTDEI